MAQEQPAFWADIRNEGGAAAGAKVPAMGSGPPFASWARAICNELGLPGEGEPAAAAIARLACAGPESHVLPWAQAVQALCEAAPGLAAAIREHCFSEVLRAGNAAPPGAPDGRVTDVASNEMAGRLRLLFGLPAIAAGRAPEPWLAFAEACAPLVAILHSFERLWLDPEGKEIAGAVRSAWLEHASCVIPEAVLLAFAGRRSSVPRRMEVLDVLARPAVVAHVKEAWSAAFGLAREAITGELAPIATPFLAALEETMGRLDASLWVHSLLARSRAASLKKHGEGIAVHPWSMARALVDIERAVARIHRDPTWSSSVDMQRWGVAPVAADVTGDWFPRGLIELSLHAIGGDRAPFIRALLEEIPPGELRYYRGFRGIPPDSDSLGLMLLLASFLPHPPAERLASWLSLLPANLGPDGVPAVWLRRSESGPTHEPADIEWAGDRCTACLLSLLLGLVALAGPGSSFELPAAHAALIPALVSHVLGCLGEQGFSGCHHYDGEYALHLFFRIAHQSADPGLEQHCKALAAELLATQKLDGSWGSPQRTAWKLESLCLFRPEPLAIERAARYLSETQRGDGSWAPEMVYYTVGKPHFMVDYQGIEVTTAMCARAMHAAHRALHPISPAP